MTTLKNDDLLLYRLIGTNSFGSRFSSFHESDPEKVDRLYRQGVDLKTAGRAVFMSRYWGISPEEIIERNL